MHKLITSLGLATAGIVSSMPNRAGKSRLPAAMYRAHHSGSIATGNRWTGKPHEHRREIARRLRQQGGK